MKTITLPEFLTIVENASPTKTRIQITEYDPDGTFSITINRTDTLYLKLQEKNRYDILFEALKEKFVQRYTTAWMHDIVGNCKAYLIIDEKVIITFNYCLLEGTQWLYDMKDE